jgi:hypothetical protein
MNKQPEPQSVKAGGLFALQPQPAHHAKNVPSLDVGRLAPGVGIEDETGSISDRSMSKKEKDILDVMKQIQKATDKTNSLLGNTDHFKFKLKNVVPPTAEQQER